MPKMWQDELPQADPYMCCMWISSSQAQKIWMVTQSTTEKGNWNWKNEIFEDNSQGVQESDQGIGQVSDYFSIQIGTSLLFILRILPLYWVAFIPFICLLSIIRIYMPKSQEGKSSEEDHKLEQEEEAPRPKKDDDFVLPDTKKNLRGCVKCGLLKTRAQWLADKECENCGTFTRFDEGQNTTTQFQGLIGLINPKESFIRKRAKIYPKNGKRLKSAAYGI